MSRHHTPAYLATSPQDYARLGLQKDQIALWEDGMRTNGGRGNYEWWYFDAHLSDGSKLVIVFMTKPFTEIDKPLSPLVTLNLDYPDGKKIEQVVYAKPQEFWAAKEHCEVRIGKNIFQGDLRTYHIQVVSEEITVNLVLRGTVPAWRPETGQIFFGEHAEHYFAWLPAVPQGEVKADIMIAGNTLHLMGVGYHDHNWGNLLMAKLMNNWYWARGAIGDYTAIASFITAEQRYADQQFPIFLLAKDGQILADDGAHVQFEALEVSTDEQTGKPVANLTRYTYRDAHQHYVLSFRRKQTILRQRFVEQLRGLTRVAALLARFDGAYLRFTGDIQLDRYEGDRLVETLHEEGIWELMYFGHVH